jgi:hypothetical protein
MATDGRWTRREALRRSAALGAAAFLLPGELLRVPALAATGGTGFGPADYLAFADSVQRHLDPMWRRRLGVYAGQKGSTSAQANMLLVHSLAALAGHSGPTRNDARAQILADRLCASPPWRESASVPAAGTARIAADQTHDFGWGSSIYTVERQHVVIDTGVVRGLAAAYHARAALGLREETAALIRDRLQRCAYSSFYRYPALRLNQINWPLEIYFHASSVLGHTQLLRRDTRQQLERFMDRFTHGYEHFTSNVGPGYRFHRMPATGPDGKWNIDSTEYASLVFSSLSFYEPALEAGMKPLSAAQMTRLRAWGERVLYGYWTHAGYPNWDTGDGFDRWHQTKKFPLCLEGVLTLATSPRLQAGRDQGRWAKYVFDQGLAFYAGQLVENGGLLPPFLFGIDQRGHQPHDPLLTAARMQSLAMRALVQGLGGMSAAEPPPLYSYDPDIGRLAITTPAYNTAVVPVNQDAFPYGGVELARFFDGSMRVAGNVGGTGNAAFGVVVRDDATRRELRSQTARRRGSVKRPPLRLLEAPRGTGRLQSFPRRPYGGPFEEVIAAAFTSGAFARIHTRLSFRAGHIEMKWRVVPRRKVRRPHTVRALFPSWGETATVTAVLRDGSRVPLTGETPVAMASVAWFDVRSEKSGYVVVPQGRASGKAFVLRPSPQSSQPRPGPTLVVELLSRRRLRPVRLTVRVAPAPTAARAEREALRLA